MIVVAAIGGVRFDIGAGFTVPTQAVFVPMLFALPVALVPLLVALSLALAMAPAIAAGRVPLSRILTVPGNSWFAVGPALVLLVAHDHSPDGRWGVLVLALGAQFACDFCANATRERLRGGISIAELAREVRQVYLIDLALAPLGLVVALAAITRAWVVLLVGPLFGVLRCSAERHARMEQLIELNGAYRGTALLLGDVVEADDSYTGEHCKDVVRLALAVAREMGLDADEQRLVEFAALLHDIGKIAVPKEIVNKPGALDEQEWAIIKTHTWRVSGCSRGLAVLCARWARSCVLTRALGRWRLPRRVARGADPPGCAHRVLLRHVQRDDHHAALSKSAARIGGGSRVEGQLR